MKEIPYGYCHCGCGEKTVLAPLTYKAYKWVKGEPVKFIWVHALYGPRPGRVCPKCKVNEKYYSKSDKTSGYCKQCDAERSARGAEKRRNDGKTKKMNRLASFNLTDTYIKNIIKRGSKTLWAADIPPEMVKFVREYIRLLRLLRKPKLRGEIYVECD